jgi:hypothetical protein
VDSSVARANRVLRGHRESAFPRALDLPVHARNNLDARSNVRFDRRHRADPGSDRLYYIIELYRELIAENGAPSLGMQNQMVEFILPTPTARGIRAMGSSGRPG